MTEVFGDNYAVRVTAAGRLCFDAALRLAFNGRKATHYALSPRFGMIFLDNVSDGELKAEEHTTHETTYGPPKRHADGASYCLWTHGASRERYRIERLPYPMTWDKAAAFSWGWLEQAAYPREPDHDGSNDKGFTVSTGDHWGHVGPHHGAVCHVAPDWIMLGK